MKRKWKWLILLCLPVLGFAVWLWAVGGRQIPVDVIGGFSEKDATELIAAAKSEQRRQIFPNLSLKTLKSMPAAIRRYSNVKLITVCERNSAFAIAFLWQKTNGVIRYAPRTNYDDVFNFETESLDEIALKYFGYAYTNAYQLIMYRDSNGWHGVDLIP